MTTTAIKLQYLRAHLATLSGFSKTLQEETDEKGNITSVTLDDEAKIRVGMVVNIDGKRPFKIRYIDRMVNNRMTGDFSYQLWYDQINDTSILLLSSLSPYDIQIGVKQEYFYWHKYFVNAYLKIGDSTELDYKLHLLYRFVPKEDYLQMEQKFMKSPLFEEKHEPDRSHVIYTMNIPKEFHREYDQVIAGKYSKLSDAYKDRLTQFHNWNFDKKWFKVLHRTKSLREKIEADLNCTLPEDAELCEMIDLDGKETYQWDMIVESNTQYGE